MGRKLGLAGAMAAVIFAATACGDDEGPTGVEGDQFTEAEAEDLAQVIMSEVYLGFAGFAPIPGGSPSSGVAPQASGIGLEPQLVVLDTTVTGSCELGGERTVGVEVDFETSDGGESGTITIDATATHEDCGLPFRDETIVLNGNPNLTATATLTFGDEGVPLGEQTFSYGGGFAWETDDRSGACGVDLDATVSFGFDGEEVTSVEQHLAGTFCGHEITRDFTLTL